MSFGYRSTDPILEARMVTSSRPLAVVTDACSGIGFELARQCAGDGYDLLITADSSIADAVVELERLGARVEVVKADLSDLIDLDDLLIALGDRPVEALFTHVGHGLGKVFVDQDFEDILHVLDANITGPLYLIHRIARGMRARRSGRIVIAGAMAGFMPGSLQAVFRGATAFIDSFVSALRSELEQSGVSVTCLVPGNADLELFAKSVSRVRGQDFRMDPSEIARIGFAAMTSQALAL
jgi:uncharacterized protein